MYFSSALVVSSLAAMAAAGPVAAPREIVFTTYNNSDTTCADANVSGSSGYPSTPVGACQQFPAGTSSVEYRVPAYASGSNGCTVDLYTNEACNGPAIESFTVNNGDLQCKPPIGGGWASVRFTCPN